MATIVFQLQFFTSSSSEDFYIYHKSSVNIVSDNFLVELVLSHSQNSINSLSTGRCLSMPCNFKSLISKHVLLIQFMNTCEITFRWIPQNTFDDKSVNFASVNGVRQQAITRANVDSVLYHHMASLGHNELTCLWRTKSHGMFNVKWRKCNLKINLPRFIKVS